MYCRGVRGAITVDRDTAEDILEATRKLLQEMIQRNGIEPDDVASAVFTTTPDLTSEFPALAARQMGWHDVALLCGHEMTRPGALGHCIRILIHWNTTRTAKEIEHVYLREAVNLRPDRATIENSLRAAAPAATSTAGPGGSRP